MSTLSKYGITETYIRGLIKKHKLLLGENDHGAYEFVCYHTGSARISEEEFDDMIWFSSKPLGRYFGKVTQKCRIRFERPLIVDAQSESWDDPLWRWMFDEDGQQTKKPDDPRLLVAAPKVVWEAVEDDVDGDIEWGDIPHYAKNGKFGDCDGVIIKNIGETPIGNIYVDDYVIFNYDQIIEIL